MKSSDYPKIGEGHPAFERVEAMKAKGIPVCDSMDHNTDCTNPNCPVWGMETE